MPRLSSARRGQLGMATNEIGIVAVVCLILGGIAVQGFEARRRAALVCLGTLASAADGRLPAGARCPVSGALFVPVRKDGTETIACPDPKNHYSQPPRYEREEGKLWRLEQDLPSAPAAAPEAGRKATTLVASASGTTSILRVSPRFWWRWIGGPLVQLLAGVYLLSVALHLRPKECTPRGIRVALLVAAIFFGGLAWHSVATVEGSEGFEFDSAQRRVTHRRFLFGVERAPKIYDACDGVVLVQTWAGSWSLVLLHRGPNGRAATELVDGLSEGDVALGSWLRSRFRF
jgi:hypothetical protein